jgi:hypothetical protein
MRRVVSHLWPVLHYRSRSRFRLYDGTAPLCHTVATVTGKSDRARSSGRCGTR